MRVKTRLKPVKPEPLYHPWQPLSPKTLVAQNTTLCSRPGPLSRRQPSLVSRLEDSTLWLVTIYTPYCRWWLLSERQVRHLLDLFDDAPPHILYTDFLILFLLAHSPHSHSMNSLYERRDHEGSIGSGSNPTTLG